MLPVPAVPNTASSPSVQMIGDTQSPLEKFQRKSPEALFQLFSAAFGLKQLRHLKTAMSKIPGRRGLFRFMFFRHSPQTVFWPRFRPSPCNGAKEGKDGLGINASE
jgi:hypothetical protein